MDDVTRILQDIERGEPRATDALLPLVYAELKRLAAQRLRHEGPGHTLQATALVHEAYVRLAGAVPERGWDSRGHFFAAAAEAMRRILVESARRKGRLKHGGGIERADLDEDRIAPPVRMEPEELLALDEALEALRLEDPRKAMLVDLRYFAGLTLEEAAQALGVSRVTAHRDWSYTRAWLRQRIDGANSQD